jgi:hypothetical protein
MQQTHDAHLHFPRPIQKAKADHHRTKAALQHTVAMRSWRIAGTMRHLCRASVSLNLSGRAQ